MCGAGGEEGCVWVSVCVCVNKGDQEETLKPNGCSERPIMPWGKRQGSTIRIIN